MFCLWLKSVATVFMIEFHRNWCYGSKSDLCCESGVWDDVDGLSSWESVLVWITTLEDWKLWKMFRIRNQCIDRCDDARMVITKFNFGNWIIIREDFVEVKCIRRSFTSEIFGQYLKRSNYVVYFRGSMDVDQSRMKEWFFESMKLMLRGVLMGVRFERIHSE